jgi:hypothetical protein
MPSKSKSKSRSRSPTKSKRRGAPRKYSPCKGQEIRDPKTKRCREKKSRGRKVGQVAKIDAVARALAIKTADAYSFNRYKNWVSLIKFLLKHGYSKRQSKEIVRSKLMRWAADGYEGKGKVPTTYFKEYLLHKDNYHDIMQIMDEIEIGEYESDTETESESDKE